MTAPAGQKGHHVMTSQPVTPLHSLEQLAAQLTTVQDQAENLRQREDAIKAAIRQHPDIHGVDDYAAGNLTISIQPNHRFDQKLAERAIPAHLLPLVTVEKVTKTIDRKRVEVLAPDHLEACIATYDDKVVVK